MEGRALRGAWGGWGRIAPEVGTTLPRDPGLITPGASLARGDQEQSQRQTAPRSHPSGASQLSPFCEGAPGALAKFGFVDRGFRSSEDLPPPDSLFLRVAKGTGGFKGPQAGHGGTQQTRVLGGPRPGCSLTVGEGLGHFLPSPFPRAADAGGVCRLFPSPSAQLLLFLKLN